MQGFDMVLMGHDHAEELKKIVNVPGLIRMVIDPASNRMVVFEDINMILKPKDGRVVSKKR